MNLLAVDTARGEGGVALLRPGSGASTRSLGAGPRYGEVLFAGIGRLLADCSLRLKDVDAFAVATGPGSFTGIRVGISAVKAMAEAGAKPVVGVSSLRALACSWPGEGPRAALLDARRGELFMGCFGSGLLPLVPETLGEWRDLSPRLQDQSPVLVWNEPHLFEAGGPAGAAAAWTRAAGPPSLAVPVAEIAQRDILAGLGRAPEAVEANYIRRPSARPPPIQPVMR